VASWSAGAPAPPFPAHRRDSRGLGRRAYPAASRWTNSRQSQSSLKPDQLAGVWANWAQVSHSDYEFTLDFVRLDFTTRQGIVVARVSVSPLFVTQLIDALNSQWQAYAEKALPRRYEVKKKQETRVQVRRLEPSKLPRRDSSVATVTSDVPIRPDARQVVAAVLGRALRQTRPSH
jgi:hypothetical protein